MINNLRLHLQEITLAGKHAEGRSMFIVYSIDPMFLVDYMISDTDYPQNDYFDILLNNWSINSGWSDRYAYKAMLDFCAIRLPVIKMSYNDALRYRDALNRVKRNLI